MPFAFGKRQAAFRAPGSPWPMKILLTGATGFVGSRLRRALLAAGHRLVCPARRAGAPHPQCRWVEADFAADAPPPWHEHLAGVDAVVNTVGLFRERGRQTFDALHVRAPVALFDACAAAGVARVLQLSALGVDAAVPTPYQRSKHAADVHLLALPLDATVVQPSLVFGPEGASSQALLALVAAPLLPVPRGTAPVQPLHVDDLVAALMALLAAPAGAWRGRRVALVGPEPMALRTYLQTLRHGLDVGPALVLPLPAPLVALAARAGDLLPGALLNGDAWRMLRQGNAADAADTAALLGRAPRPAHAFVAPPEAPALRLQARLGTALPLLRAALAITWFTAGVVSLGLYPVEQSHALLARAGVPAAWRPAALGSAALFDLLLGLLTLWPLRGRAQKALWGAQALLVAFYTALITWRLPEFWLHPYGPIVKNLPILAALLLLGLLTARR